MTHAIPADAAAFIGSTVRVKRPFRSRSYLLTVERVEGDLLIGRIPGAADGPYAGSYLGKSSAWLSEVIETSKPPVG